MAIRRKVAPKAAPTPTSEESQPTTSKQPGVAEQIAQARPMTAEETDAMARQTVIDAGQPDPAQPAPPPPMKPQAPAPPVRASVEEEPEKTTAVATRGVSSLSSPLGQALYTSSGGAIVGDFDLEDIKFPELKVVQGSGKLSAEFSVGSVILGGDVLAYPPQDLSDKNAFLTLRVIPLHLVKFYRETLTQEEQDDGAMPEMVYSKAALMEVGGTVGYGPGKWRAGAIHNLLVEKPDNLPEKFADSSFFDTELDGKLYAPAKYWANGGAYKDFSQAIISATRNLLTEPVLDEENNPVKDEHGVIVKKTILWKYFWTWKLTRKSRGNFQVWSPDALCRREPIGPDARDYCDDIHPMISGGAPAAASE